MAGNLYGFEANIQCRFTFLLGVLSNFGINANYIFIGSNFTLPDGRSVPIPRQADHLANVAIYYDDGRFSSRLAMNYKGAYISEYGSNASSDNFYDEYTGLDFSVNYDFSDTITIYGEATNLLNDDLNFYQGERARPLQVEYYGLSFFFGVKVRVF